jgi:hypothetical protein
MTKDRFDQLWQDYLEGDLDEAGLRELDSMLEANPEWRSRAADEYELHRHLGLVHQAKDPSLFVQSTLARIATDRKDFTRAVEQRLSATFGSRSKRSQVLGFVLVSAATLIFSLVLQAIFFRGADPVQNQAASEPIATLVRAEHARWEPNLPMAEGQRLKPGTLKLGSGGRAFLLFDSGALMALQGPVECDLETRGLVHLKRGKVTVRAEGDAGGFTVRLPSGEARDLGTEFMASAEASGACEIHVLEGEVAWAAISGGPPATNLRAGQAMRFETRDASLGRPIAVSAQSVESQLRQASASKPRQLPSAVEDFKYDIGEIPLDRATGGIGWAGPWRLRQGVEITPERDSNKILAIVSPGRLRLPPGHTFRLRPLSNPIDQSRDSVTYLSFSIRRELQPSEVSPGIPHFRLTLRSSGDYWGTSIGIGYPQTGKPTIQLGRTESFFAPMGIEPGTTTLWVIKLVSSQRSDQVFLKVFQPGEPIGDLEPAPWTVVTRAYSSDSKLDLVVVTGSGPASHELERLRIGPTWDSVVRRD